MLFVFECLKQCITKGAVIRLLRSPKPYAWWQTLTNHRNNPKVSVQTDKPYICTHAYRSGNRRTNSVWASSIAIPRSSRCISNWLYSCTAVQNYMHMIPAKLWLPKRALKCTDMHQLTPARFLVWFTLKTLLSTTAGNRMPLHWCIWIALMSSKHKDMLLTLPNTDMAFYNVMVKWSLWALAVTFHCTAQPMHSILHSQHAVLQALPWDPRDWSVMSQR